MLAELHRGGNYTSSPCRSSLGRRLRVPLSVIRRIETYLSERREIRAHLKGKRRVGKKDELVIPGHRREYKTGTSVWQDGLITSRFFVHVSLTCLFTIDVLGF